MAVLQTNIFFLGCLQCKGAGSELGKGEGWEETTDLSLSARRWPP